MASTAPAGCPLCDGLGGALVWQGRNARVIRAQEEGFPAFYRVVWTAHAAEFTDLSAAERAECMELVAAVERVLRDRLSPDKVNLAALGNMVAHLHWHVIARWRWDSHFPGSVWAAVQRPRDPGREAEVQAQLDATDRAIAAALDART
ncbi:HIT family protein [Comamonas terrigena]|uniref:HIT family protein n=1 Tax=Comamonas terrigena TaxID=32013 RepID=A0A2A7V0B6_COMTR|nr:HIT family protein [Comamonas terrigena]MBD9533151.1 HIT family protein [Comamonas sp. CMM01]PEH90914.1 HIT family protein [Comamonas terrigena]SUY87622.1 HIT domain [Comamonas terrigena]